MRFLVLPFVVAAVLLLTATRPSAAASSGTEPDSPQKRGCCSHHKGVCGCKDRTVMCCDGSASPTCTC